MEKINKLTGSRFFFVTYLVFFGVTLLLSVGADNISNDYLWFRGSLRMIVIFHLIGGLSFFVRFCIFILKFS